MSKGETVKTVGWTPQQPPSPKECADMRQIVVESVFALHLANAQPCTLADIYKQSQQKVMTKRDGYTWTWPYRHKRTWDRRVNEAASREHGARIVAVKAGVYKPNPALFKEDP